MHTWPTAPLATLCEPAQYGLTAQSSPNAKGPRYLRVTDIRPRSIVWTRVPRCDVLDAAVQKYRLASGDIVIARSGSVGFAKQLRADLPDAVFASYLVRFRALGTVCSLYLGKVVESEAYRTYVEQHATGAAQPNANAKVLGSYPVPVPPLETQGRIAAVLDAYDELIENNLRRIKVLEGMAAAVYREWFVDYRFPGHSGQGGPPGSWATAAFGDLAEVTRISIQPSEFPGELFDHFSFAAYDENRLPSSQRGEELKSAKLLVRGPAVLLAKLNPHIRRVWLVRPDPDVRSVASTEFLVLTAKTAIHLGFVYETCRDGGFHSRLAARAGGTSTSHQRLKLEDLQRESVAIPPTTLLESFERLVGPMHELQANLARQNRALTAGRDYLLPRLVSGEIDVSGVDIDTESILA